MEHKVDLFNCNYDIVSALSDCGFPGAPAHSSVEFSTGSDVRAGTVARYSCDRGFELLGPARRICGRNGTWTPQGIPFCGKEEVEKYRCFSQLARFPLPTDAADVRKDRQC